jgi:membrane protease YdiL (CAAX protease family)
MKTLMAWMRQHTVSSYFFIAFGLSWTVWIPMAVTGVRVYQGQAWPTHILGLFGPMAAALIMSTVVGGVAGARDLLRRMVQWRVSGKWYMLALSPVAIYAGAVVTLGILGRGWPNLMDMGKFSGLPAVAVPVMALLLLGTTFGEETGWRGFAVPEMLKTRRFLSTAIMIGLLWTLWHVPLMFVIDNYRQMGIAMFPALTLGIVSGSIVLTWIYRESGGSLLIVAVWHGCFNLVSGTAVASGIPAAIVSAAVMVWAVLILIAEVRRGRREKATRSTLTPASTDLITGAEQNRQPALQQQR